ncbi:hypothetical protein IW261DRAFT_1340070 [Armillaria novae-zelandiae]|uniref:Aminoglycoside phosphotransferase domain-containing protein n=1 Tax=Armillaria novae-zelandiae TaxID=153914 RepID=A0AA39P1G6_9AGAR|nr:hypothetical protein IW261DRAFT_1340070 [Armillaria novae-zelandiae]
MSPSELDHITEQFNAFLACMETLTSPTNTMGSVTGGSYCNAFWPERLAPEKPLSLCHSRGLPRGATTRFTHADLVPKKIIVEGSVITGIVDWALSGFFPDF